MSLEKLLVNLNWDTNSWCATGVIQFIQNIRAVFRQTSCLKGTKCILVKTALKLLSTVVFLSLLNSTTRLLHKEKAGRLRPAVSRLTFHWKHAVPVWVRLPRHQVKYGEKRRSPYPVHSVLLYPGAQSNSKPIVTASLMKHGAGWPCCPCSLAHLCWGQKWVFVQAPTSLVCFWW